MAAPSKVLDFLLICGKLKTTKRTGWVNNNVLLPESVSDHMYRMGILSFLVDDEKIDKTRAMKVALVHDLAESLVGDITPFDKKVTKEQKRKLEQDAMDHIRNTIGGTIGKEIYEHWLEYESAETPEAKLVKDFDKFEMILQAHEYEMAHNIQLGQFYESTRGAFKTSLVQSWVAELEKRRSNNQKNTTLQEVQIRTELGPGDMAKIVGLHARIYSDENGYDGSFEALVAETVSDLKPRKGLKVAGSAGEAAPQT